MKFTDTHCHIHEITASIGDNSVHSKWQKAGITDVDQVITRAREAQVQYLVCVGTTLADSKLAVDLVQMRDDMWASIGIHPHEAKDHDDRQQLEKFAALAQRNKVVAVGECGLDYYYEHSPKAQQRKILEFQLYLAQKHDLPLIFHVRDAHQASSSADTSVWDDFFAIVDNFKGVRGVVHSFTANKTVLDKCLNRGLYIGLNGIMTFTKDDQQLQAAKAVPLDRLLLETDAPFLTPAPDRGTICEPKHTQVIAEFLSALKSESLEKLASQTTQNAQELFKLTSNSSKE